MGVAWILGNLNVTTALTITYSMTGVLLLMFGYRYNAARYRRAETEEDSSTAITADYSDNNPDSQVSSSTKQSLHSQDSWNYALEQSRAKGDQLLQYEDSSGYTTDGSST